MSHSSNQRDAIQIFYIPTNDCSDARPDQINHVSVEFRIETEDTILRIVFLLQAQLRTLVAIAALVGLKRHQQSRNNNAFRSLEESSLSAADTRSIPPYHAMLSTKLPDIRLLFMWE